jgi:hypothetical protein
MGALRVVPSDRDAVRRVLRAPADPGRKADPGEDRGSYPTETQKTDAGDRASVDQLWSKATRERMWWE